MPVIAVAAGFRFAPVQGTDVYMTPPFAEFCVRGVTLSLYLAIINMLPVPPLDGSKLLLAARIPISIYQEIARYGFMVLIVLVSATNLGRWMNEWSYLGARAIFSVIR